MRIIGLWTVKFYEACQRGTCVGTVLGQLRGLDALQIANEGKVAGDPPSRIDHFIAAVAVEEIVSFGRAA